MAIEEPVGPMPNTAITVDSELTNHTVVIPVAKRDEDTQATESSPDLLQVPNKDAGNGAPHRTSNSSNLSRLSYNNSALTKEFEDMQRLLSRGENTMDE